MNRPPETSTPAYARGLALAGDARRLAIRELADVDADRMREPERVQLASMLARLTDSEAATHASVPACAPASPLDGATPPESVAGAPAASQGPLVGSPGGAR